MKRLLFIALSLMACIMASAMQPTASKFKVSVSSVGTIICSDISGLDVDTDILKNKQYEE